MNRKRDLDWAEIEITSDETSNDTKNLEVNLDEDLNEDNGRQEAQDTRRTNFTVSKNTNENKEDKNNQARTQVQENQEERAVPRQQARQTELESNDEDEGQRKGGRAQRRIQNLTRIKNEQDALIQRLAQENQALKSRTRDTEKRSAAQMRDQYKQALDDTELALEQAVTANDTKEIAKLSRKIADLTMRHNAYQAVTEDLENEPESHESAPTQQVQQTAPHVPEEAKSWIQRNPWFFKDEVRHVAARAISRELSEEGVDPEDREYWDELDTRLKKKFNEVQQETPQQRSPQQRKGPVSSSRSEEDVGGYDFNKDPQFKRNGRRVQANPTQADYEMAEKLGISIEDQMKEKFKYAQQGYSGYVKIDIPGQS